MGLRTIRNDRRLVYDISGEQPRVVMETDTSNAPVAWYIYGLGLLWKVSADGTPYFYHFDGDGNTVAVSNPTKGVVNTYRYDATGRLAATSEAVDNIFRARGEAGWVDEGNGLIFNGRDYQFPELRLTLPGTAEISAPGSDLKPQLGGLGTCFLEPVSACLPASGRRTR
jgi:hypothetical protein